MWSLNAELALFNLTGSSMMVYCTSDGVSCFSTVLFSDVLFLCFDIWVGSWTLISFVFVVKVETVVVFNPFELDCCPLCFFFPLCLCFPCFLRLWGVADDVAGALDAVWGTEIDIVCAWTGLVVVSVTAFTTVFKSADVDNLVVLVTIGLEVVTLVVVREVVIVLTVVDVVVGASVVGISDKMKEYVRQFKNNVRSLFSFKGKATCRSVKSRLEELTKALQMT